jgi:hypothetical protein
LINASALFHPQQVSGIAQGFAAAASGGHALLRMSPSVRLSSLLALAFGLLGSLSPAQAQQPPAPDRTWQTVQQYFSHNPPGEPPVYIEGTRRVNSFVHYTHIGTDFGFHGPAAYDISWRENVIRANLRQQPDAWAGMWHCLAGLARESGRVLSFAAPFAPWIESPHQPRIDAVQIIAGGNGNLKLEIQNPEGRVLWSQTLALENSAFTSKTLPLDPSQLLQAKFLNWTAEPGSDVALNRISLGFRFPNPDAAHYSFLTSFAKISKCYEGGLGLVRDRAHTEPGAFDTVPTSGLFALATAAAATPELGIVSPENARKILREIDTQVAALDAPLGLLPHFARFIEGRYRIHPGTEYSTIDTAIYYQSMLIAARMLDDLETEAALLHRIRQIPFSRLILPNGAIAHGLQTDGSTLLAHGWNDWGGETILVLLLRHLADPSAPPLKVTIDHPGKPWQGTGFIAEVQSLLFPHFDTDTPDTVSATAWRTARSRHLKEQQDYINRFWRGTLAHEIGLYGLSAGENETGNSYQVCGTALPHQNLIHPHYFLMSARLREHPQDVLNLINDLRRVGFFPPYGLVENVTVTGNSYLPMIGSLNAGFEALAAYHFLCQVRNQPNRVYQAADESPQLRQAIRHIVKTADQSGG